MNYQAVTENISEQLKEFMGDKKAIIGLSGGIDSAVIAYLCAKALGKDNVLGISLPCNSGNNHKVDVSSQGSIDDACTVAKELGIQYKMRDISSAVKEFLIMGDGDIKDLTLGNVMARVRMISLYMYANEFNGMVIGTTNKTEAAIGYYTKYGDGAVDVEPIADLYKTEIWELAKVLGVPQQIIDKKPSAELWDGHSDEEELGMTYQEIDEMLAALWLSYSMKPSIFWLRQFKEEFGEKGEKLLKLIQNSEHKRHMPPAFKIS